MQRKNRPYLLVRKLHACLDHGAKNFTRLMGDLSISLTDLTLMCRTYHSAHVRLGSSELGENMLEQELLHVALDLGVAHDEGAESRGHVERTIALRRGRLPVD